MTLTPALLAQLRAVGLGISQHRYSPRADEWFSGTISADGLGGGDVGPYESAEGALVGGVAFVMRLLAENIRRADVAETALRALQAEIRG